MSRTVVKRNANERLREELGLSSSSEKIRNNLNSLIVHPILNGTFFIHEDQEFIKNNLETILALISNDVASQNIDNFLNLFSAQTQFLVDDFSDLYKLKNKEGNISNTISNKSNFLNDPFDDSNKIDFRVNQEEKILVDRIKHSVVSMLDVAKQFNKLYEAVNKTLPPFLEGVMEQINDELVSFRRLRNIADNAKTEEIYNKAVSKYRGLESNYRMYFYFGISIVVIISVLLLFCKTLIVPKFFSNIEFWVLKGSILVVGITLITYFLKQSSHYQHLADQNYQTQVELQAYPSFMESIPPEEAASVRKELALKYFGREIDGASHKDMSNLIADQMKSTTEIVKASTEAIKNLKG